MIGLELLAGVFFRGEGFGLLGAMGDNLLDHLAQSGKAGGVLAFLVLALAEEISDPFAQRGKHAGGLAELLEFEGGLFCRREQVVLVRFATGQ
ncbi:hypothetical protein D3C81_2071730 [compost metagenome]